MATPAPNIPAASKAAGRAFFAIPTTAAPANIPTEAIVSTVPSVLVPTYGRRIGLRSVCRKPMTKTAIVMSPTTRRTFLREATARQPANSWAINPSSSAPPLVLPAALRTTTLQTTVTRQVLASTSSNARSPTAGSRNPASSGEMRYLEEAASWSMPEARTYSSGPTKSLTLARSAGSVRAAKHEEATMPRQMSPISGFSEETAAMTMSRPPTEPPSPRIIMTLRSKRSARTPAIGANSTIGAKEHSSTSITADAVPYVWNM